MYENFLSAGILNGFPCVVHHNDDRVLKFDWLKILVTITHHPLAPKKSKTSQKFSLILLNLEAKLGINFKNVECLRKM